MDHTAARRFSEEWVAAWNSHDLDRILSHYSEDFEMASPYIVTRMQEPSGKLRGKSAIRTYWAKGLAAAPDLKFELIDTLLGAASLVIYYRRQNGHTVAEVLEFDAQWRLVTRAFANYSQPV
jgi:ketosteroid isomerase-like protein